MWPWEDQAIDADQDKNQARMHQSFHTRELNGSLIKQKKHIETYAFMKNVNIQLGKYTLAFVMPWTKILLKSLPLLDFYFILGLEYLMAEGSQSWQPLHFHKWNISKPPNLTVDEESSMTFLVSSNTFNDSMISSFNE